MPKPNINPRQYLSSGSTLLNLACSGHPNACFKQGHYYLYVGDSSSGKTFHTLTMMAEASHRKSFRDHRLIYNDIEQGALMDFDYFFGPKAARKIEAEQEQFEPSPYLDDFYDHITDVISEGQPFIYVLDSMDAIEPKAQAEETQKKSRAKRKGEKTAGSYGTAKAKMNSARMPDVIKGLKRTNSILVVISQTRDDLGFGFNTKTRSGGHALRFYATVEIWTSVVATLKKTVRKKDRQVGVMSKAKIKKNRVSGRLREVVVPIFHDYGIDDIGSQVDYLLDEGHWEQPKQSIIVPEFDFTGVRDRLIRHIEDENLEKELKRITAGVWNEIEEQSRLNRKNRYS